MAEVSVVVGCQAAVVLVDRENRFWRPCVAFDSVDLPPLLDSHTHTVELIEQLITLTVHK